eukprot:TRINITY_DN54127_c0_g1_i1.p1 TRINITY_DN54127_c0_g1~~TRINITY_DN54127_c0_g1_i1.p1  ORF type:complete len:196 (+),score=42.40 TRINITY_DN54127_c0_g1_i1:40-588(+)
MAIDHRRRRRLGCFTTLCVVLCFQARVLHSLGFVCGRAPITTLTAGKSSWRAEEPGSSSSTDLSSSREYFLKLGWINVSPESEIEYVARFNIISGGLGGADAAYEVIKDNNHVLFYGQKHLETNIAALKQTFGADRAVDIIRKNPSALTIPADQVLAQSDQIATIADGIGFFSSLGKQFGLR